MNKIIVPRMAKPDFSAVLPTYIECSPWKGYRRADISASVRVCATSTALHLRFDAVESEIRAEVQKPNGAVCQDSCMEFFFAPDAHDDRYFNFELNAIGTLHLGLGDGRQDRMHLNEAIEPELFSIHPELTKDGWAVSYCVPFRFIRLYFPDFDECADMRCNFYKCGDKTSFTHYYCWNKVETERPDFHRPEHFGIMRIEGI